MLAKMESPHKGALTLLKPSPVPARLYERHPRFMDVETWQRQDWPEGTWLVWN